MSERLRFVVGTAGHIDHGKTALVRALTGIDTDRLPEEKARGITIDLGFAGCDLGPDLHLGFVDVPGHERFVKNMLAGVGGIDVVLLVVAADESIMPQTREHFEICSLLGVRRGVVALTKIDLVTPDLRELAELEVREFLHGSALENAEIVAVSTRTGEGIPALRGRLEDAVRDLTPRDASGPVRLPVDRAFTIRGFGTVVTGTLFSGTVAPGDELALYPLGRRVRVRRVEVHGREAPQAQAGERVALNLQGIEVAEVGRGDVIATPEAFRPSRLLDVRLRLLPSAPSPLRDLARVRFHLGTAEVIARVKLLDRASLEPDGAAFAQLRLDSGQVALPGDRFIVRRYSPARTIGGGTVLDPLPEKHRGGTGAAASLLARLEAADPVERLALLAQDSGLAGCRALDLQVRSGLSGEALRDALDRARQGGRLVAVGEGERAFYLDPAAAQRGCERIIGRLEAFHRGHPLEPGMGKEALRAEVLREAPVEVFRHLLESQEREGRLATDGDKVRRATHRVRLSDDEQLEVERLEGCFRQGALDPPGIAEAFRSAGIAGTRAETLLHLLLRQGRLVRLKGGAVFHAEALADLRVRVLNFRKRSETIDIGEFKDLSGTTRKNAIPLLEYLDAERVTRREGNRRRIVAVAAPGDGPGPPAEPSDR